MKGVREHLYAMPEYKVLFDTLPRLHEFLVDEPNSHGLRGLVAAIWDFLGETATLMEKDSPFVWFNLGFSSDLLLGLGDVGRICVESQAALQSLMGEQDFTHELIDLAEARGIPNDCCSADKAGVGAMVKGLYPNPVCSVGINTPCDTQVMSCQAIAEISKKPSFIIDVPYYDDERTIEHVAAQLAEVVPFLEEHTGRKMDWGLLRRACELTNESSETIWEWLDWRKMVPLSQSSKLVAFTLVHQLLLTGTEYGVRCARGLRDEARERHEKGERFFEERVRAVWYQDPVWTDMQIYDWMERELGLTVPVDVFGFYAHEDLIDTSTPDTMLYGLARKLVCCQPMSRQFRGNIETYISDFMHMHEAFKADCGIFAGHVACKHAWGGIGLFREACRKAGIPLLVFEFDMFDSRVTPRDAIQAEVSRFVNEVVWPQKIRKLWKAQA